VACCSVRVVVRLDDAELLLLGLGRSAIQRHGLAPGIMPTRAAFLSHRLVEHFLHQGHERLLHVATILGRSLNEGQMELVGELLACDLAHHALGCQIALVADKQFDDVTASIALNLCEPLPGVVEGDLIRHVINQDHAMGATIIAARDCPEPFLSGGIPNLHLDDLALKVHGPDLEVDANGGNEVLGEGVIGKTKQEGGLAHATVANHQNLEKMIVVTHRVFLSNP